jgi:autophagy-related protein 18
MKVLHTIRDVPSNREGLCALSSNSDNSYLAYPGSSITGEIQVFDTLNLVCRINFCCSLNKIMFIYIIRNQAL